MTAQKHSAMPASSSVKAARTRLAQALAARVESQSSTPSKGPAPAWHAIAHKAQASQNALPQVTNLRTGRV